MNRLLINRKPNAFTYLFLALLILNIVFSNIAFAEQPAGKSTGEPDYRVVDGFSYNGYFVETMGEQQDIFNVIFNVPVVLPEDDSTKPLNDELRSMGTEGSAQQCISEKIIYESDYDYNILGDCISILYSSRSGWPYSEYMFRNVAYHYDISSKKFLNSVEYLQAIGADLKKVQSTINGYWSKNKPSSGIYSEDNRYIKQIKDSQVFIKNGDLYYEIFDDYYGNSMANVGSIGDLSGGSLIDAYRLILKSDNNSFIHTMGHFFNENEKSKYTINGDLYNKLAEGQNRSVKKLLLKTIKSDWKGSCFGISASMALSKIGEFDLSSFDPDADNFYKVDKPKDNIKVRELVNYYQLAQLLPAVMAKKICAYKPGWINNLLIKDNKNLGVVLRDIISKAEDIKFGGPPLLVCFGWGTLLFGNVGHCVIANNYETLPDGGHKIEIVDPNYTDKHIYLMISKDLSSWSMEDSSGAVLYTNKSNWLYIGYMELGALHHVDIDGGGGDGATVLQTTHIVRHDGVTFIVEKPAGLSISDSKGKTFNLSDEGISGDMVLKSLNFLDKAIGSGGQSDLMISIPIADIYRVTPQQSEGEEGEGEIGISLLDEATYASVEGRGIQDIVFTSDRKITISANNTDNADNADNGGFMDYSAYVSNDASKNNGLLLISDDGTGNVTIERSNEGIVLKSDGFSELSIQSVSLAGDKDAVVTTDKKAVLIKDKPDDDSKFQVLVSKNDDGTFDKVIATGQANAGSVFTLIIKIIIGLAAAAVLVGIAVLVIRKKSR